MSIALILQTGNRHRGVKKRARVQLPRAGLNPAVRVWPEHITAARPAACGQLIHGRDWAGAVRPGHTIHPSAGLPALLALLKHREVLAPERTLPAPGGPETRLR